MPLSDYVVIGKPKLFPNDLMSMATTSEVSAWSEWPNEGDVVGVNFSTLNGICMVGTTIRKNFQEYGERKYVNYEIIVLEKSPVLENWNNIPSVGETLIVGGCQILKVEYLGLERLSIN
jgi:hypothetical protein